MNSNSAFSTRVCPCCGSSKRSLLFELKAEQFCSVNWTYSNNYRELLGIPENVVFPIDRCSSCGFVYSRLLPSEEFLTVVYDEVILGELCRAGSENTGSYARRMRYIATLLETAGQDKVLKALDFGCGLGISLKLLATAGIQAVGFDPSHKRAVYAGSAGYYMADDEKELEKFIPYDILICDNVLEHVPDPLSTISSLASFCREGSLLYVSVPSYEEGFISEQLDAIKKGLPVDMTLNPWEHLNYFDLLRLDRMLKGHGFSPVAACDLAGPVDIGLRPEPFLVKRVKNSIASMLRLMRYAASGVSPRSVTNALYRFSGGAQ